MENDQNSEQDTEQQEIILCASIAPVYNDCVAAVTIISDDGFYETDLGALGDGGAIISNQKEIVDKVRALGNYGLDYKYHHIYKGHNSRLDEMQAVFLQVKLQHLDRMNEVRRRIANRYLTEIHNDNVILLYVIDEVVPVWHIF